MGATTRRYAKTRPPAARRFGSYPAIRLPPNHPGPANVGLTRLGGSRRLGVRPGGVPVPI